MRSTGQRRCPRKRASELQSVAARRAGARGQYGANAHRSLAHVPGGARGSVVAGFAIGERLRHALEGEAMKRRTRVVGNRRAVQRFRALTKVGSRRALAGLARVAHRAGNAVVTGGGVRDVRAPDAANARVVCTRVRVVARKGERDAHAALARAYRIAKSRSGAGHAIRGACRAARSGAWVAGRYQAGVGRRLARDNGSRLRLANWGLRR